MRVIYLFVTLVVTAGAAGGGVFAQTPGADIHYVPTPDAVVSAMLDVAQVTAADVVYDLGSGDGRIVIEAARKYGARPCRSHCRDAVPFTKHQCAPAAEASA